MMKPQPTNQPSTIAKRIIKGREGADAASSAKSHLAAHAIFGSSRPLTLSALRQGKSCSTSMRRSKSFWCSFAVDIEANIRFMREFGLTQILITTSLWERTRRGQWIGGGVVEPEPAGLGAPELEDTFSCLRWRASALPTRERVCVRSDILLSIDVLPSWSAISYVSS